MPLYRNLQLLKDYKSSDHTNFDKLSPLDYQLKLPNRRKILGIMHTLLVYTVASLDLDPNPRGGGQLLNPNECNSTPKIGTRGQFTPTVIY